MSDVKVDDTSLFMAYGALMTMAIVPIYVGSVASLKGMKRPANAQKRKKSDSPLEDSEDEDESVSETLSSGDAWMFPVFGSVVLFSLYLLFRYLDTMYINYLITAYFSVMGCAAVAKTGLMLARQVLPSSLLVNRVDKYRVTLSRQGKRLSHISFTIIHFILLAASVVLTVYYGMTKNWIASNIFGISFSINAVQLLSLDSFKTGMILLSGLFFYDIFWVFGTEVMVTVAKSFDAPIKVVFPRNFIDYVTGQEKMMHTMLGLGDIVIPGIFVALCLRFDRHMAWQRRPEGEFRSTNFPKPYFNACLTAYVLGLGTTMGVMHFFKAAQPALLYLSPACILSVLITAAARGELKEAFAYTSEEPEKEEEEKKTKKGRKSKKSEKLEDKPSEEAVEQQQQQRAQDENEEEDEEEEEEGYVAVDEGQDKPRRRRGKKGSNKKQ